MRRGAALSFGNCVRRNSLTGIGRDGPNIVGDPNLDNGRARGDRIQKWFNTAAFKPALPFTYGNASRTIPAVAGPGLFNIDFSIFKDFKFTETIKLQFRAEAVNVANTPQFSTPDANLSDAKLAATATTPAVNGNGNFGKVLGANVGTERHIQFQLRLQF